jgi:hypothetical protein
LHRCPPVLYIRMLIPTLLTHVAFCKAVLCRLTNVLLVCGGESPRGGASVGDGDTEFAVDEEGSSVVAI